MQDVCAVRFADHLPSARPVYDPAKKCKDTVVSARQIVTLLMYLRLRPAPAGFWGVLGSFAAFVAAQREPAKSTSSGARNVDGKWQKQQDQRALQSRDVNNGSYLVTWVTSCSSRQPLPNLWTSLVHAEPQQSPCVTLCTCCEHRASFADIFASRKVPGH